MTCPSESGPKTNKCPQDSDLCDFVHWFGTRRSKVQILSPRPLPLEPIIYRFAYRRRPPGLGPGGRRFKSNHPADAIPRFLTGLHGNRVMFCNTRNLSNLSNSLSNDLHSGQGIRYSLCQTLGRICLVSRGARSGRVLGYSSGSTRVASPKLIRFFGKFGARLEQLIGDK